MLDTALRSGLEKANDVVSEWRSGRLGHISAAEVVRESSQLISWFEE